MAAAALAPSAAPAATRSLTWLGWLTAVEAAVLMVLAAVGWWPALAAAGIGLAAVVAVAVQSSPRRLDGITAAWELPARAHAGAEVELAAVLHAPAGAPPLALEGWTGRAGGDQVARFRALGPHPVRVRWLSRFPHRGRHALPPLVVRGIQPFGLVESSCIAAPGAEVLVLPAIGRVRARLLTRLARHLEGTVARSTPEPGDDDLARLRTYRPGDPPRIIHWRASARHHHLLVAERQPIASRRLALAIDAALPPGTDAHRLERLICAAATIIDTLWDHGWELSLHGCFAPPQGVRGDRLRLFEALALVAGGGEPLRLHLPTGVPCLALVLDDDLPDCQPAPLVIRERELGELVRLPGRLADARARTRRGRTRGG